jgi:hypothetical protein
VDVRDQRVLHFHLQAGATYPSRLLYTFCGKSELKEG